MPKGVYDHNKIKGRKRVFTEEHIRNMRKPRSETAKRNMTEITKKLIEEGKIPRINSGCFKKGHTPWMKGKFHSKETIAQQRLAKLGKSNIKCSITKKRLFKEGKLKPSSSCFKKGHIPHGAGKTKENYEPLKKSGLNISRTKNLKEWKETKGIIARKKMSASKQGIPLNEWQNFISFEPYNQNWTNKFKRAIRKRDNQVCMLCGVHREKLNRALDIHHINYDKKMSIPENCISLCVFCHTKTHTNRKHWTKFFQSLLTEKYNYQYSETNEIILEVKNEILNN